MEYMIFKKLRLTLFGLIISVCSLNSHASIIISGDVANGTGIFEITDDIVFNLEEGAGLNPNSDPYAMVFHDWHKTGGAWGPDASWGNGVGARLQLVGDPLDFSRGPTPFNTVTDDIFVTSDGTRSDLLSSAPLFDGNLYNIGSVLYFSDTYQGVRQLGPAAIGNGDTFTIGAGIWDMPIVANWDLYGEFSGQASIYEYLAVSENSPANMRMVSTTNLSSVPEPSTLLFFALGAIGFASRRLTK
jgi:hypothetical protein